MTEPTDEDLLETFQAACGHGDRCNQGPYYARAQALRAVLAKFGTPPEEQSCIQVTRVELTPEQRESLRVKNRVFIPGVAASNGQASAGAVPPKPRKWAAPKYNARQRAWCEQYERESGFEPLMDDYEYGNKSFVEAAVHSLRWYEDHTNDIHLRISKPNIPGGMGDSDHGIKGGQHGT